MKAPRFTDMPKRIAALPVDRRGYPVPKFVEWIDGEPDFRVMDPHHLIRCVRHRRCWVCGEPLGAYLWFVIGPMCAVNRISSEPPSHYDCGRFACEACPFLTLPKSQRRSANLPVHQDVPGMLPHNPGAALLWRCKNYSIRRVGNSYLFELGEPLAVEAYAHGRKATRAEVDAAVALGLPQLHRLAYSEGPDSMTALTRARKVATAVLDKFIPVTP